MDDAVQTVMQQCELWTDNNDMDTLEDDKVVQFTKGTLDYPFEKNKRYKAAEESKYEDY